MDTIDKTHYLVGGQRNGSGKPCFTPLDGPHEWTIVSSRTGVAGRNIIDRECEKCGLAQRWLQLARPRR